MAAPTGLMCDLLTQPAGYLHSACQIRVFRSTDKKLPLWGSGKTASGQGVAVPLQGTALPAGQEYSWDVRVGSAGLARLRGVAGEYRRQFLPLCPYAALERMARIADALGKRDEAKEFAAQAAKIRQSISDKLFDSKAGRGPIQMTRENSLNRPSLAVRLPARWNHQ